MSTATLMSPFDHPEGCFVARQTGNSEINWHTGRKMRKLITLYLSLVATTAILKIQKIILNGRCKTIGKGNVALFKLRN
jgi:hypothetical protein